MYNQQQMNARRLHESRTLNERQHSRIDETLLNADWQQLADRSQPLPQGITPEMVMEHFGRLLLIDHEQRFGAPMGHLRPYRNS